MYPLIRISLPRSRALALAAILALTASNTALYAQTPARPSAALPSLGDNSELPAAAERRLGDRIAASIYRDPDYIDDPVLVDYVQTIWQPLMAAARARGELNAELDERFAWELFLIRDRSINAFALPGGYLGAHLGLISTVTSRDELAAVLAHELSHVTQRHISRLYSQQARTTPWMIGAMILGALAASKSPQAASAAMASGQALAIQSQLNFSRDMEREADRVGINVMLDAGFDAKGAASMFEKLQQASRLNDNGSFPYLRSHPLNSQRIGEVQARLQLALQDTQPLSAADQQAAGHTRALHAMMAARARVLAEPGIDALRALTAEAQRLSTLDERNPAAFFGANYAGVMAAAKMRDFALAALLADKVRLAAGHPDTAQAAKLLVLEVDLAAGKLPADAQTLDISKTSQRAELLLQSRTLLAAGRSADVVSKLSGWVTDKPKDSGAWQLLAAAYGNQGQTIRAIRADAESHAARLDYPAALDRLKAAQATLRSNPASGDFMDSSIIDTRVRQVELLVREQALQDKLDR